MNRLRPLTVNERLHDTVKVSQHTYAITTPERTPQGVLILCRITPQEVFRECLTPLTVYDRLHDTVMSVTALTTLKRTPERDSDLVSFYTITNVHGASDTFNCV